MLISSLSTGEKSISLARFVLFAIRKISMTIPFSNLSNFQGTQFHRVSQFNSVGIAVAAFSNNFVSVFNL